MYHRKHLHSAASIAQWRCEYKIKQV